ncbi:MAG: hypothetical protein WCD04_02440 [Terriglobia bacterium]|jgi:hypothetical protein
MSRHERRYQKYLDRHRQEQANKTTKPGQAGATAPQIALAATAPIHEALVPAKLFELGVGNLLFSRSLPDGRIALGAFLLDIFCLGVKNAFFSIVARDEYAQRLRSWSAAESLQPMQPACFRKLVEGGVAYAHELGFNPHVDYDAARQIFGDVQATSCPTHFGYGHDGKPFYVSGPHETPTQVQAILEQLERRLGPGNFDYLVLEP